MKTLVYLMIIIGAIGLVLSGCSLFGMNGDDDDDDGGGESSDFRKISGSGTITIHVTDANTDHGGEVLMYGASGISFGQYERVGSDSTVSSDDFSLTIHQDGSGDFIFTGGQTVGVVAGIIDVNGDYQINDGDYYAFEENVTVNGDETITFDYPADFSLISNSGTITIEINGANTAHNGHGLMYGASGIPFGQYERVGGEIFVDSDAMSLTLQNGGDFEFTGGTTVGFVGCIIDNNGSNSIDDGDWYAIEKDITISGDETVTFNYPTDFNQISGTGTVTLQILNANDSHSGEDLMYGASGIIFGEAERTGDSATISSDDFSLTIPQEHTVDDFQFIGGDTVGFVGCIIDANADGLANDDDYIASRSNVLVNGDRTITFEY